MLFKQTLQCLDAIIMAALKLQVWTVLATLVLTTVSSKNQIINILTLLPYPDTLFNPSWRDGPQVSVALEIAKEDINNRTDILLDYQIELIHGNSGCEYTTKAYEAILNNVYSSSTGVVGIIGPGYSSASIAMTTLSSRKELSLITVHGGSSPILSDRTQRPYALGTLGSSEAFAIVGVQIMQKHNWRRVGIIFEEARLLYSATAARIGEILSELNSTTLDTTALTISGFVFPVYDSFIPLNVIVDEGLRVNLLLTSVPATQRIICLAFHRGMVYPKYQWVITSNTFEEVAKDIEFYFEGQEYNCSAAEMQEIALNRTLFFNFRLTPLNESAPSNYSKISFKKYDRIYRSKLEDYNLTYSIWTTYFYDALWAWAVVLDRLSQRGLDLTKFRYGNTSLSNMVLEEFYRLDFEGVSGRIKFNNDSGLLTRPSSVFQVVNSTAQLVAIYDDNGLTMLTSLDPILDHFPDQFGIEINRALLAVFIAIILFQLIALIILHILSIKYRHVPSVKASSLKLNQLLYIGYYLFTITLLLYIANVGYELFDDEVTVVMCNIQWFWLFPISFTLTFGTVAVRTWRLHRIFTHYLNPGHFIADHYLVAFVFILLGVDVLFGTLWVAIDPQQLVITRFPQIEGVIKYNVLMRLCVNSNQWWSFGLVFGYKLTLMTIVLVLAFITRNIKNQSFTTVTLRTLVYLSLVDILFGFFFYYLFRFLMPLSPASFIFIVVSLNIMLFFFMGLVCIPPLLPKLKEELKKCSQRMNFTKLTDSS